jgi:hypothetical protein
MVRTMPPHMVVRVSELTGYAGIRRVDVSVPLVEQLVDGVKYFRPGDAKLKPPERSRMFTYRNNPAPVVHDRRARDVVRGLAGHVIEDEVTDPFDATSTVLVARSVGATCWPITLPVGTSTERNSREVGDFRSYSAPPSADQNRCHWPKKSMAILRASP